MKAHHVLIFIIVLLVLLVFFQHATIHEMVKNQVKTAILESKASVETPPTVAPENLFKTWKN